MTSPGYQVNPDDLHRHASQRRVESADFITDKPPEIPSDPDDPTTTASSDLTSDVHSTNHALHNKSSHTADKVDADGHAYSSQEQSGTGKLGKLSEGVDAQGIGALINPFATIAGQGLSALGTLFGQATSATATLTGQLGGQTLSAGSNLVAKNMSVGSAAPGVGAPAGGAALADKDKEREQTQPAAATTPLAPQSGSPRGLQSGDYVRPQEEHTVMPAGMGGGGMPMAGLGAGSSSSSSTKPRTYKVNAGDDPMTEPIPVVIESAYAPSPLEDNHGINT